MESFGEKIRLLRKERKLPLRTVSSFLDIDQAILSKIERNKRIATKEQVSKLAKFFEIDLSELHISWLSDKLLYELSEDDNGLKALQLAEAKLEYFTFSKIDRKALLKAIKSGIQGFGKIKKAWIYGSFSRKDDGPKSDIDIAIETDESFSYFDLAEVKHSLEKIVNRSIDIGFMDSFKPSILKNIQTDLKLIYER